MRSHLAFYSFIVSKILLGNFRFTSFTSSSYNPNSPLAVNGIVQGECKILFDLGVCVVNGSLELAHAHLLRRCKMAASYFVARRCPEELAAAAAAAAVRE